MSDVRDDRFQLLLDATEAGFWEWHSDGKLETVSPLLLHICGIEGTSDRSLLDRIRACAHPDDLVALDAVAQDAHARGNPYSGIVRITRENDGVARWVRVRGRSFVDRAGERRALGTMVDISEDRELLHSLELTRAQLEEAEHLAGIGSWSWDVKSGVVHWSKETYRILKIPFDTAPSFELVLGLAVDEVHRQEFLQHVEDAMVRGNPYDFRIDARLSDGSTVTIHTRGQVERDADGAPVRMVGTMEDVTEMVAAQVALVEREARFRTLAESSPNGIILTNEHHVPTYANQRLLDWFELSLEALAQGEWRSRIHPDDLVRVNRLLRQAMRDARSFDDEYRTIIRGSTRWLRVRSDPLLSPDGVLLGRVATVLDVTAERLAADERERLRAQLQQAQKLESLGLLAGGIAHDFNNLLVGILANASMARADAQIDSATSEMLADIEHAAHRAAELTRQLLAYGGRARMARTRVDLAAVARELPSLLRARIPSGVTVQLSGHLDDSVVLGDETQLRQVLMNLVTNAIDAIGNREGLVRISVARAQVEREELARCVLGGDREPDEYAVVTVADTGVGIRADVRERMFDPFFTTKASGRGLGLAATLGILNSHGGAIDVDSPDGGGTVIRVFLPLTTTTAPELPAPEIEAPSWTGRGTILLVDDDLAVRVAARRTLERAGFSVVEAENGQVALDRIDEGHTQFACVVLDIAMPVMTGDVCFHELRLRQPALPVLLSTGFDVEDVVSRLVERGAARFLQKPYAASTLLAAVRETIGGRDLRATASTDNRL